MSEQFVGQAAGDDGTSQPVVLVADDSSVARNQIKHTLDQLGSGCVLAKDGRQGLKQLKQWATDEQTMAVNDRLFMVISDIETPEMDGCTYTSEVRKDPRMCALHILLHTSFSGVFNNAMVQKVGANDVIAKFQPDALAKTVLEPLKNWKYPRAA